MSVEIQRRWGVVVVAVLMFLFTLAFGSKGSLYFYLWIMCGYYAYKGNLESLRTLVKYFIYLNIFAFIVVLNFFDDNIYYIKNIDTKNELLVGIFIMTIPKAFLYLYANKEINSTNQDKSYKKNDGDDVEALASLQISKLKSTPIKQGNSMEDAYSSIYPNQQISKNIKPNDSLSNSHKHDVIQKTNELISGFTSEVDIWSHVYEEYGGKARNNGLWAKLFATHLGDENKVKAEYFTLRYEEIKASVSSVSSVATEQSIVMSAHELANESPTKSEIISDVVIKSESIGGWSCEEMASGKFIIHTHAIDYVYVNKETALDAIKYFGKNDGIFSKNGLIEKLVNKV